MPALPYYPIPRALFEEGAEDYIEQWITRSLLRFDASYAHAIQLAKYSIPYEGGFDIELPNTGPQTPTSDH